MNRGQRRAQWRARRTHPTALPSIGDAYGSQPVAINVHVGELALRGFEASHGRRIADALQHSLTAMLSSQGIPDAWSRSSRAGRTNGGKLQLATGASPRAIGEELARRVLLVRTDERS